jgi:hypothetical protein
MVYKDGATTGLTIGELVCVRHKFVPNCGGSQIMTATLDKNLGIDNHLVHTNTGGLGTSSPSRDLDEAPMEIAVHWCTR